MGRINWEEWAFTLDGNRPPWGMDRRHVEMLEAFVRLTGAKSAVEIGCYMGRSTVAFVEAKKNGASLNILTLCELEPSRQLIRVVSKMPDDIRLDFRFEDSADLHFAPYDQKRRCVAQPELWHIDGNHGLGSVRHDYFNASDYGARFIALHDSAHKDFPGVRRVAGYVKSDFPHWFEDKKHRPGEETERGFLLASNTPFPDELTVALGMLAGNL